MRAAIAKDKRPHVTDVPEPVPGDGEILIDVTAAGVNRADLAQAAGHYPPPPGASEVLGLEASGVRRDTGEQVVALLAGGACAETVAVPPEHTLPLPTGMDPVDAAGVIEVSATVVSNLIIEAGLQPGETVMIHGATGGIGSFAVQFAHQFGARVLASVGSDEAIGEVERLGADRAWNRRTTDLEQAMKGKGGADVILDVVGGGEALGQNVRALREFGRLVIIGVLGGPTGELPIGALMGKRGRVIATTIRSRSRADKAEIVRRTHELVWPLLESGAITIPIERRLPLEDIAEAHAILRDGGHLGKVLLTL